MWSPSVSWYHLGVGSGQLRISLPKKTVKYLHAILTLRFGGGCAERRKRGTAVKDAGSSGLAGLSSCWPHTISLQAAVASQPFPAAAFPGQPWASLAVAGLPSPGLIATLFLVTRSLMHLKIWVLCCYILFSSCLLINVINSWSVDNILLFLSRLSFLFFGQNMGSLCETSSWASFSCWELKWGCVAWSTRKGALLFRFF